MSDLNKHGGVMTDIIKDGIMTFKAKGDVSLDELKEDFKAILEKYDVRQLTVFDTNENKINLR